MTQTLLPNAVHWSEGMLLSPQHLQQHDMAWQAQINHRFSCSAPHARGVRSLAIDRESLARGVIRVTGLECLLDDGHAVLYPGGYADLKLECDVAAQCKKEGRPVRVWIALPRRGIDGAVLGAADKRYDLLPGEMTADENLDNGYQVSVVRMQARVRLVAGSVPPQYAACPLLDVELDAQGRFRLGSYHPPMLQAGASAFQDAAGARAGLQTQLQALAASLWVKLRELAGNPGNDGPEELIASGSGNERGHVLARHLGSCLPQLEIAVASGISHPETLYRALAEVVGRCAAIGSNPVPLKMEAYAHDDCMPQFQRAIDYIEAKLKLVDTAYDFLEFARIGDAGFARRLPAGAGDEVLIELKARDGQSLAVITRWLNEARIASASLMPELRKRRLGGARVRALTAQEILQHKLRPNAALFAIHNDTIEIDGRGRVPMFASETALLIEGSINERMPAAIVLYADKPKHASLAGTARQGVAAGTDNGAHDEMDIIDA